MYSQINLFQEKLAAEIDLSAVAAFRRQKQLHNSNLRATWRAQSFLAPPAITLGVYSVAERELQLW